MAVEFNAPDFVQNSDPETIHERMMSYLPADISAMPGDFPYDFTKPTAIELSQFIQLRIVRALMIAFPEYAWESWLDMHGDHVHVKRRDANKASGVITVQGEAGVTIPAGTIFCVPATDGRMAIEYETDKEVKLAGEPIDIPITAVAAGKASNVAANTVSIMLDPMEGILSITNKEPITGGTEIEDDASYYERIHAEYEGVSSYVGNDSDYIRWAKEVTGIGDCIVVPAWNGPGTVKLILVDSNGQPANKQLLDAVYEHIVSPSDRSQRLLPSGDATLTVEAATNKGIRYVCTGLLLENTSLEVVQEAFKKEVMAVYTEAKEEGVLRYNDVRPVLSRIIGVEDFEDFRMNDGYKNIPLGSGEYAYTESVEFSEGGG